MIKIKFVPQLFLNYHFQTAQQQKHPINRNTQTSNCISNVILPFINHISPSNYDNMAKHYIPFTEYKHLKIVHAFINGTKCSFIFNADQLNTVVNSTYFTQDKTKYIEGIPNVFLPKLRLYGLKLNSPYIESKDLSTYEKNGRIIHGIFGKDIIDGFDVTISNHKFILTKVESIHPHKI